MRKSAGFGALLRNIAIAVGAVLVATLMAGALIWFDVVDTVDLPFKYSMIFQVSHFCKYSLDTLQ